MNDKSLLLRASSVFSAVLPGHGRVHPPGAQRRRHLPLDEGCQGDDRRHRQPGSRSHPRRRRLSIGLNGLTRTWCYGEIKGNSLELKLILRNNEEEDHRDCGEDDSSRAHGIPHGDYHHQLHGVRTVLGVKSEEVKSEEVRK